MDFVDAFVSKELSMFDVSVNTIISCLYTELTEFNLTSIALR